MAPGKAGCTLVPKPHFDPSERPRARIKVRGGMVVSTVEGQSREGHSLVLTALASALGASVLTSTPIRALQFSSGKPVGFWAIPRSWEQLVS